MPQTIDLFGEAERQMRICNACRFCEGYCAVYPALERRTELSEGDVAHLANLCHDCRACYYACMYAPPHVFAINPPEVFAAIRTTTYEDYLGRPSAWFRRRLAHLPSRILLGLCVIALFVVVSGTTEGFHDIWARNTTGSPYRVLPYPAVLAMLLVPFVLSLGTILQASRRYWMKTHGVMKDLFNIPALNQAFNYAASLKYLKGGGPECYYPEDRPSAGRRHCHAATAYGFTLCLLSTIAAGIMQDLAGSPPPYGIVSVPVILGILGGAGLVLGSTGLIALKEASDPDPSAEQATTAANYGFLIALDFLAITGILSLLLRHQGGFGIVFLIHISAVALCFLVAPYTKFVHFVYRFLALVKDSLETLHA